MFEPVTAVDMEGRPGWEVVAPSLQPAWTTPVAKRSASPIDVDARSVKRPPGFWPTISSGGDAWPLDAHGRRILDRSQPANGRDSHEFWHACAEISPAFHGSWTDSGNNQQYQHYRPQEAAYPGDYVGHLNNPSVTLPLSPGALGSSTDPTFATSHITCLSLSNASKNPSVPSGPGFSGGPGVDQSPSFSPASSFPGLRMADSSLSHLSLNISLTSAANHEPKLPVGSHAPLHPQTLTDHGSVHHVQEAAFHGHKWFHPATSPLGCNTLADVSLSPSTYIFPLTEPGPLSYQCQPLGASSLLPFGYHRHPPYCNPPSDANPHVDASPAIGSQTSNPTAYTTPTIPAAGAMFNHAEQDSCPGDQPHEAYAQVAHPGQVEPGHPDNMIYPADTGRTVLSDRELSHGPAYPGFPPQHFPSNLLPGNQSLAFPTPENGLQNSLCSEPARSGSDGGCLPEEVEEGSETDVTGRTDRELTANQPERKKRGPFDQDKREKVNKTRKRGACLVCKIQRNECTPNKEFPDDPDAPCMRCLRVSISTSKKVVYRVPCMRSTISQLVLHRPGGLGLTRRWEGAKAKDVGDWADDTIRTIHMFQGLSLRENPIIVKVRKFRPKEGDVLCKGTVHLEPYCLADVEQTAKYFDDYLKRNAVHACTNSCLDRLGICRSTGLEQAVKGSHHLVRDTYAMAVHHATKSLPAAIARASGAAKDGLEHEQRFLLQVIKFIYAIKHMSGSVEIIGEDKLNMEPTDNPDRKVWLPRMIVAQWDGIQNERILKNLTKNVLSRLDKYLTKKDQRAWFTIYLVVFIFLHEVSVASKDRLRWARENASLCSWSREARYGSGKLGRFVEHLQASTNILLAHWEYYKAGVDLQSFDWEARHELRQLDSLTQQQANFVRSSIATMQREDHRIPKKPEDDCWEHELYFISHMFSRHEKALETFNYLEP